MANQMPGGQSQRYVVLGPDFAYKRLGPHPCELGANGDAKAHL